MSLEKISKFISLILRHKPDAIGITLDGHGWAKVDELIKGISEHQHFDMAMLEEIVATDEKKRYSFNEDKTLIRANQGHSVSVDVELLSKKIMLVIFSQAFFLRSSNNLCCRAGSKRTFGESARIFVLILNP